MLKLRIRRKKSKKAKTRYTHINVDINKVLDKHYAYGYRRRTVSSLTFSIVGLYTKPPKIVVESRDAHKVAAEIKQMIELIDI